MRVLAPAVLAASLLATPGARAQGQGTRELGLHALATAGRATTIVVGPVGGVRPLERLRLQASAGVGVSEGALAARGEALAHFLLQPSRRRGLGWYGGGGLALVGAEGATAQGYLVVLLGVENAPRGGAGWGIELGVGGGVRVAGFHRWRRHPAGR